MPVLVENLLLRRATRQAEPLEAPPIVHDVLRSPGRPLDPATRDFMEPRFGHDFSQVRVHTDAKAAQSARAVDALAYTVGRNVVFGVGRYAPEADEGRKLLAHELAHVAQQRSHATVHHSLMPGLWVGKTDDPPEREADQVVNRITGAQRVGLGAHLTETVTPSLRRQSANEPEKESKCRIRVLRTTVLTSNPLCRDRFNHLRRGMLRRRGISSTRLAAKNLAQPVANKFLDFFPARSEDFKGQCCKGRINDKGQWERANESDTTCCPVERIVSELAGHRCCAQGEKVQEGKCVVVPKDAPKEAPAGTVSIPSSVGRGLMTGKLSLSPSFLSSVGSTIIDGFGLDNPILTGETDPKNPHKDYFPNRLIILDGAAKTLTPLLQMDPGATIEIWGYTDATGAEAHNQTLGQQRADFVRSRLILDGVAPDKLQTHSAGSSQPVVKTGAAEPSNRRVEIRFKPSIQSAVPQSPKISPTLPAPRLTLPGEGEKP